MCRDPHSSKLDILLLTIIFFLFFWKSLLILPYGNQVLFKLVVITVLVIAESADNCIKTVMLLFIYIYIVFQLF